MTGPIGLIGLMIVPMGLTVPTTAVLIAAVSIATDLVRMGPGVAGEGVGAAGAGVFPVEAAAVSMSNKCGLRIGKRTGLRMTLLGGARVAGSAGTVSVATSAAFVGTDGTCVALGTRGV